MKKQYAVLLSLAMLFSLAACGSTQEPAAGANTNPAAIGRHLGIRFSMEYGALFKI